MERNGTTIQPVYNGVGDRVGQTVGVTTTNYALDIAAGLPEVIASQVTTTSEGNAYLHLPGVIVAESSTGETRYLLSDGLGSVRQAVDDSGLMVAYHEFDPYGNPIVNRQSEIENPYGFTGEWWEDEVGLLHLRARWYSPGTGTFLSVDPVESEPPYQYVRGNPVNRVDPSGFQSPNDPPLYCSSPQWPEDTRWKDDPACQLSRYTPTPTLSPPNITPSIPAPENECQPCRPGKSLNGYSEFTSNSFNFIRPIAVFAGKELVFDYRTLEVAEFNLQVEPRPIIQDDIQFDIGVISWDIVWGMNFISGLSDGGVIQDYRPTIRVFELGGSGGYVFHAQAMGHVWGNSDGLSGRGLTYGLEASLLDLILGFTLVFGPLPPDFGPELASYNASTTDGRVIQDFGDVCNRQDAQNFLNDLQTRSGYGLSYSRSFAVSNFKQYVRRSSGFQIP